MAGEMTKKRINFQKKSHTPIRMHKKRKQKTIIRKHRTRKTKEQKQLIREQNEEFRKDMMKLCPTPLYINIHPISMLYIPDGFEYMQEWNSDLWRQLMKI